MRGVGTIQSEEIAMKYGIMPRGAWLATNLLLTYGMSANIFDQLLPQSAPRSVPKTQSVAIPKVAKPTLELTLHVQQGMKAHTLRIEQRSATGTQIALYAKNNPLVIKGAASDILTLKDIRTNATRIITVGELYATYGAQVGVVVLPQATFSDGKAPAEISLLKI